ncbi:Kallmann syndrome 1 sequence [Chamberlinius hualienensis]
MCVYVSSGLCQKCFSGQVVTLKRLSWWIIILLTMATIVRTIDDVTSTLKSTSTTTVVDVAGSNREWFAIALCRATCLDTSGIFKSNNKEKKQTPLTTTALPTCVVDTTGTCGPAIHLTQQQKLPCSTVDGSSCPESLSDYDKCVQLCQNPIVQKSCLSSCSSHQFLLNKDDQNQTSQQSSWMTTIVPLSPPLPCHNEKPEINIPVDESIEDNYEDEENDDENSSVEDEDSNTDDNCNSNDGDGVLVKEVWDTKGAHLRWASAPKHHCPPLIDSLDKPTQHQWIVYIVQMRQLLRLQPTIVADEWKTITATTETMTDLKYVLTLGLHYQVRVIAISARGICSATLDSRPFGLPKGHPSPGQPRNLRYIEYNRANGGVLGNTIHWDPPTFTFPISKYLITWFPLNQQRKNPHQTVHFRHHLHSSKHPPLYPHVAVSGKRRTYHIRNLIDGQTYVVKVQAVAKLGDTDIHGEPASLKFSIKLVLFTKKLVETTTQIPPTTLTSLSSTTSSESRFNVNIIDLNVSKIYFESEVLKAKIHWNFTHLESYEIDHFTIKVHSQLCPAIFQLDQLPKREQEQQHKVPSTETSFIIKDLRFDCIYQIGVSATSKRQMQSLESTIPLETPPCNNVQVFGDVGPDCPPSAPHMFHCSMDRETRIMTARCHWTYRHSQSTLKGFLIVAQTHQSSHRHGEPLRNTSTHMLVNKDARQVVLTELVPNNKYYVTIRVVGVNGFGPNAHAHFFASSPPFYHGSHTPVTYQAWQTNKSAATQTQLITILVITAIALLGQQF